MSYPLRCLAVGLVLLPLICGCAQPLNAAGPHVPMRLTASGRPIEMLETKHYRLMFAGDRQWVEQTAGLVEGMREEFYRSFGSAGFQLRPVSQPLLWMCFDAHSDFEAYSRKADNSDASSIHGYYSLRTNIVAVAQVVDRQPGGQGQQVGQPSNPPATVQPAAAVSDQPAPTSFIVPDCFRGSIETSRTLHEAAHQLAFNSGLQTRGVPYPMWVSEGLAMQFEPDSDGSVGLGRDNPDRRVGLLLMRSRGRLIPLSHIIILTQYSSSLGRSERELYAQSWGLFRFLYQTRPTQLQAYLAELAAMPAGRTSTRKLHDAFVRSFGRVEAVEAEWLKFLGSLPTDTAGLSRPARPRG